MNQPLTDKQKTHRELIQAVVHDAIGSYASMVGYEMELNDVDDDATAFLVELTHNISGKTVCVVMQGCDDDNVEILYGEEFDQADSEDLLRYLFISLFMN